MGFLSGLGRIGKAWATVGLSEKDKLFGTGGKDAQYIDPALAAANHEAALKGAQIKSDLMYNQSNQLGRIAQQFSDLNKQSPDQLANAQIERQRRAAALGFQNQQNNINQQVARRGLGNSASGLFASLNNQRQQQNQLADLESSRFGLQRGIMSENLNMQNALIGQQNNVASGVQMPGTQFMNAPVEGTKGLIPGIFSAVGGVVGGIFGGPGGAAAGAQGGKGIGGAFSDTFQKPRQRGFGQLGQSDMSAGSYGGYA